MEETTQLSIILIVGILSGVAMYIGNTEMASLGMGGLVGFLSQKAITKTSEKA
jgi:hypothetical protein